MADLKTDYKDDVLDTSKNTKRKYKMIQNADGTVSFEDVTVYKQEGDSFGGADINATNKFCNSLNQSMKLCGTWKDISATTDANGNALIGNVKESQVPIAVTPITVGTRISAINLNGYGLYYAETDIKNSKISLRVLYSEKTF